MKDLSYDFLTAEDINQIDNWRFEFKNNPNYKNICLFVSDDQTSHGLTVELKNYFYKKNIENNNNFATIVGKNKNSEVCCVLNVDFLDCNNQNLVYLHKIFVNPKYQKSGLGYDMLSHFCTNVEKYFSKKPEKFFANIKTSNHASIKLFKSLGFEKSRNNSKKNMEQYSIAYEEILEKLNPHPQPSEK